MMSRIFTEHNPNSYYGAKATALQGKGELLEKNAEKAQELFLQAQTEISNYFGSEHPMVAKFNQYLIEAYNLEPESRERIEKITAIC